MFPLNAALFHFHRLMRRPLIWTFSCRRGVCSEYKFQLANSPPSPEMPGDAMMCLWMGTLAATNQTRPVWMRNRWEMENSVCRGPIQLINNYKYHYRVTYYHICIFYHTSHHVNVLCIGPILLCSVRVGVSGCESHIFEFFTIDESRSRHVVARLCLVPNSIAIIKMTWNVTVRRNMIGFGRYGQGEMRRKYF